MNRKQRVLIIDDEKANLKILSGVLKNDVEVMLAKNGELGFCKAVELKPDLILLDVIMPEVDGFEVIIKLKNDVRTCAIPVIFVTGELGVRQEEKGLELGACDYIQKPFHVEILKARVKLHLKMAKQRELLEKLANIDPLTTIANRRLYDQVFDIEWTRSIKEQTIFSLIVIDLDDFKKYNDFYGHAAGDLALEKVANAIANNLTRPRDFIARYGGEEFVALLPDTRSDCAFNIMQMCLKAVEDLELPHEASMDHEYLTVSLGGVSYLPIIESCQDTLLKLADDMLLQAKVNGKNQIVWQNCVKDD
ncbi:diguanylate cyclase domain-containing protein [Pseudoalteromonas denitrificans]|uniref:diguanylate cyclase n=1 Tax=Pseudoalteromonas denitrificans DSM 6059 TaxID=1123010 RepID=A0A1I1RSZ0_9GAMM|nr:diguanylate cyclase [Pseudoalteromonas denitrificans]SFD37444.1 response regulator receiver modulated diguanylate cyclase [Pseudoalteromonas denitrificans DSM 6059]